jgi:uncharacterized membrane protein
MSGSPDEPSIIGTVINLALGTLLSMGATAFYLAAHDNPDTVDFSSLWHPRPVRSIMGESNRITRGHKWQLFGFVLLLLLINLLGLLALVVGIPVSISVSTLAFVHAYRVLGGKAGTPPPDAALSA